MDRQDKLRVLGRIAAAFRGENITWALGASGLLYFRGIVPDFHDLDLMVLLPDAARAEAALARLGQPLPPRENASIYRTAVFREYRVDGVEVDLMAGMAIEKDGVLFDCSLRLEDIAGTAEVCGQAVPLHALACWQRYYALMGREEKAKLVASALQERKEAPGKQVVPKGQKGDGHAGL